MKKTLTVLCLSIASFIIVYLLGAFISWKPNPALWPGEGRLIYVVVSIFTFGSIMFWKDAWEDDRLP